MITCDKCKKKLKPNEVELLLSPFKNYAISGALPYTVCKECEKKISLILADKMIELQDIFNKYVNSIFK